MQDEVVNAFRRFSDGDQAAFWEFVQNPRVRRVLNWQAKITSSRYALRGEEVDDYKNEILLSLLKRLKRYKVDSEESVEKQARALFYYLKLVLIGESDKVARYIKGIVSRDEKGCASVKGYKYSLDHQTSQSEQARPGPGAHLARGEFDETESNYGAIIRQILFEYMSDDLPFYAACVMFLDEGCSWSTVGKRLNLTGSQRQEYSKRFVRLISILRTFLYAETDMPIAINIMGIFTTEISVGLCYLKDDGQYDVWRMEYFTPGHLDTIEGKVSDWIRIYDIAWVSINEPDSTNEANVLISRMLDRRSIMNTRYCLDDLLPMMNNLEKLKRVFSYDEALAFAWVVAQAKRSELDLMRIKSTINPLQEV